MGFIWEVGGGGWKRPVRVGHGRAHVGFFKFAPWALGLLELRFPWIAAGGSHPALRNVVYWRPGGGAGPSAPVSGILALHQEGRSPSYGPAPHYIICSANAASRHTGLIYIHPGFRRGRRRNRPRRDPQPSAHEEAEAAGRRGSRVAVWALGRTLSLRGDAGSFSSPDGARATASPARLPVRKPPAALAHVAGRAGRSLRSACLAVPDASARREGLLVAPDVMERTVAREDSAQRQRRAS